jgi:hypothetical protein
MKDLVARDPVLAAFRQRTRKLLPQDTDATVQLAHLKSYRSGSYTVAIVEQRPTKQSIKHRSSPRRIALKK